MKKVIVENGITILDDHQFSDEVKQVLSVRASSRKIDYKTLSVKTLHDVGLCLYYGYRIRKDRYKAFNYLILCVDRAFDDRNKDSAEAAYYVGRMLDDMEIECAYRHAHLYKYAAECGHTGGKYHYGLALLDDRNEDYNEENGLKLIHEAAEEGFDEAAAFIEKFSNIIN